MWKPTFDSPNIRESFNVTTLNILSNWMARYISKDMHLIYIECLTDICRFPFRWYILQGKCIVIAVFIFKMINERRKGREKGREEGSIGSSFFLW